MDLKRLKAAVAELSACIDELESGSEDEKPVMPSEDGEGEAAPVDTLKMKLMKFKQKTA
jgi:hypothetical protein